MPVNPKSFFFSTVIILIIMKGDSLLVERWTCDQKVARLSQQARQENFLLQS